jgi:hypothetical protein
MKCSTSKLPVIASGIATVLSIFAFWSLQRGSVLPGDRAVLRISGLEGRFARTGSNSSTVLPALVVSLKNVGQAPAVIQSARATADFSEDACQAYLLQDERSDLDLRVPPNYVQPIFFPVRVDGSCRTSLSLKLDITYRNGDNGYVYQKTILANGNIGFPDYPAIPRW